MLYKQDILHYEKAYDPSPNQDIVTLYEMFRWKIHSNCQ